MPSVRRFWVGLLLAGSFPQIAFAQNAPSNPPRDTVPATPPDVTSPSADRTGPAPLMGGAAHAEQRFDELDQRLRSLEEQRAEPRDPNATKPFGKSATPGVAIGYSNEGVAIASSDGKFQFRFRPILQVDARFFVNEGGTNTFLLRRVRPAMEGTLFEYFDWRFMPELAGTPNVQDAFVNVRFLREIQLRAGKFKPPVGLERLAADPDLPFLERGLPTNLVPDRDIGVQLHGDILGGTIAYAAGVFNGAGDGVNGDNDNSDKKDMAGRIFIRPFQPTFIEPLRKLGIGIAATRGTHVGALPVFRTPAQTTFFQFSDGVTAGGTHKRIAPQAYFYWGPFGAFAEYTRSSQIIVKPGSSWRLDHEAWQVVGSFFLTGEEASFTTVTPKHPLDPHTFGTGAVELVARFGELRVDGQAFTYSFADSNKSAQKATNWGVGVNWHMARNVKIMADYERTSFLGGAPGDGDRTTEIAVLTRLQAAY